MTNLIIPDKKIFGMKKKKEEKTEQEKLPTPTGWRILILPFKMSEKTKGGVIMTDKAIEESQWSTNVGLVMKVGPLCYMDQEKFPTGPWCKEKDWVLFGRYAGARIKIDGGELRLLNDDEIMATIDNPEDILSPLTN